MKYLLLIAGQDYYPKHGTGDWIGTYNEYEEIKKLITTKESKYEIEYIINGETYDWYEIINLERWIDG